MDPIFGTDNRLTSDQEEIIVVSKGVMTEELRRSIKKRAIDTVKTKDLMDFSTLGLLIDEYSLFETSESYFGYLIPDEQQDSDLNGYRVVLENGSEGLEVICPINQTVRMFPDKKMLEMRTAEIPSHVRGLLHDSSYISKLNGSRALEGAWRALGVNGDIKELVSVMEDIFGIPHTRGLDYNGLMDSIESASFDGATIPAVEYLTAYAYYKRVEEMLNEGSLPKNEASAVLASLIEKFVLPEEVVAGIFRGMYRDEKYTELVRSVVMNKVGDYQKVLNLL